MFSAPIPGQSLTSEPKNYAWENPPRMVSPEESLTWHLDRLSEPKRTKSIIDMLALGFDVVTLTEGILRAAVSEGQHSIDVSLIIAPIIHEFIVGNAEAADIDFKEGIEDDADDMSNEDIAYSLRERAAEKLLAEYKKENKIQSIPMEEPMDMQMSEPVEPVMKEPMEEPMEEQTDKPMGLMSRGVV
tara:strand:+ start:498 stop:1058 length:561 start_codon:yes stop_codon:yes gene_type:complete